MEYPKDELKESWIQKGISEETVEWAKSFAEYLVKGKKALTTSQLRKFFGELRRIEANFFAQKNEIVMLKPILAYAVGRSKKNSDDNDWRIVDFEKEMSKGIGAVRLGTEYELSDFKNFIKLVEAVVAYHKYFGGK